MSGKSLILSILALAIVGIAVTVQAQQNYSRDDDRTYSSKSQDRTLLDRVGDFGRELFGGILPEEKEPPKKTRPAERGGSSRTDADSPRPRYVPSVTDDDSRAAPARAGSVARPPRNDKFTRAADAATDADRTRTPYSRLYRGPSDADSPTRSYPAARSGSRASDDNAAEPAEPVAPRSGYARGSSRYESSPAPSDSPRPLYERMSAARKSAFSGATAAPTRTSGSPSPALERSIPRSSTIFESPVPARVIKAETEASDTAAVGKAQTPSDISLPTVPSQRATAALSAPSTPSISAPAISAPVQVADKPLTSPSSSAKPVAESAPAATPAPPIVAKRDAADRGDVLLARRSPNLSVETVGPRRIAVGKESKFEITMINSGEVSAEDLLVTVDLPTWAEVAGGEPSVGTTQAVPLGNSGRQLQWKLLRLDAKSRERLVLRIVPRESRPFDLGIKWTFRESATQAMIEVQEPKLTLKLEGPRDVLFGKKELYRLRVANVGNGDAENVVIKLFPVGSAQSGAASHNFGTVPAGQDRSIEVELTARQAGTLTIKVEVTCDGASRVELAEKVVVRRAALDLEIAGPKRQYVDAPVAYRLRVTNSGSASAADVVITASIPSTMKYQSASDNGQVESGGRRVRWKVDVLRPGAEKTVDLKCTLAQPGPARLQVDCASDDLVANAVAVTDVDAMADLVMDVIDPVGPVAVGQEATYEIRLHNRGSKVAEDLELMAFFSQGIEPIAVEGAASKITLGQVTFPKLPAVAPGAEVRITIRAKAQVAGNHVFRTELQCRPLGTRLASEETTYFYGDDAAPQVLARSSDSAAHRVADRRTDAPGTAPASSPDGKTVR